MRVKMEIVKMNAAGRLQLGIILLQLMSSTLCGDNLGKLNEIIEW